MNGEVIYFKINYGQQTRSQILTKIAQIDAIIESLYNTALKSVETGNMVLYELDTGQTKTRVQYSDMGSVTRAIENYEKIRTMLQNKLAPRIVTLTDSKNFRKR